MSSHKRASAEATSKEVRLTEDRAKFDKLRQNIPEEKREYNDESSLILNLFSDSSKTPQEISSKFYQLTNRKREEFSKNERRQREDYNRKEKDLREEFMDEQKEEREKRKLTKMTPAERSRFASDQSSRRTRFFGDESDKRKEFDSEMRQKRQDFEAHLKDMRSRFDSELRNYSQAYFEQKRLDAEKKKALERAKKDPSALSEVATPPGFTDQDMKDIQSIPKTTKPLAPPEEEK